jgi:hypothetical protein
MMRLSPDSYLPYILRTGPLKPSALPPGGIGRPSQLMLALLFALESVMNVTGNGPEQGENDEA